MSIWHKTLDDIKKLLEQEKLDEAQKIINEHLSHVENIKNKELPELVEWIRLYWHSLTSFKAWLEMFTRTGRQAKFDRVQLNSGLASVSELKDRLSKANDISNGINSSLKKE